MKNNPNKIVLFIVEGVSEEIALGPILSKIISSNVIKFKVLNGDITSDYYNVTKQNVLSKIKDHVKNFMGNIFRAEDILEIIHIVDLDGAFVHESKIVYKDIDSVYYNDTTIETKHVYEIKKRNAFKSSVLNILTTTKSIKISRKKGGEIPYKLFYMSCNLDHVIHSERNSLHSLKKSKAIEFADKYFEEEIKFYNFLRSSDILKDENYTDSWLYIQSDSKSLSRCSNLALYLDKYF
jgi:hypothetical protein